MPPTLTTPLITQRKPFTEDNTTDCVDVIRAASPFGGAAGSPSAADRVPSATPPFTVRDIRAAIPPHCFKRSYFTSFRYLLVDLVVVAALWYAATFIDRIFTDELLGSSVAGFVVRHALWTAYWIAQGCVMTGLWVIGHECGHGGFSDSDVVNGVVGTVIHSLLLVPFFSWKYSHRNHHSNTGNVERDEVFVPEYSTRARTAAELAAAQHEGDDSEHTLIRQALGAAYRLLNITVMLTLGWPLYLFLNATGHKSYPKGSWVNHFTPGSPVWASDRERMFVVLSDVALVVVALFFRQVCAAIGFAAFLKFYFVPYLIVNFWLVLITFLQHTDASLPHYTSGEWDWLRGALATVDRDYGILNAVHHHIADTHVVHHLFFQMPHYHAEEATRAVKPLLGAYYRFDSTPIARALWSSYGKCNVAAPDPAPANPGVLWFR